MSAEPTTPLADHFKHGKPAGASGRHGLLLKISVDTPPYDLRRGDPRAARCLVQAQALLLRELYLGADHGSTSARELVTTV